MGGVKQEIEKVRKIAGFPGFADINFLDLRSFWTEKLYDVTCIVKISSGCYIKNRLCVGRQ